MPYIRTNKSGHKCVAPDKRTTLQTVKDFITKDPNQRYYEWKSRRNAAYRVAKELGMDSCYLRVPETMIGVRG